MDTSSFLHGQFDDPRSANEQVLQRYKAQLEDMHRSFFYKINLRTIQVSNIDTWEKELRSIMEGMDRMRFYADIDESIGSIDEVQAKIQKVLLNLYTASDILTKKASVRERQMFYQFIMDCSALLQDAIDCFHV